MRVFKAFLVALFGLLGLAIVVSAVVVAATRGGRLNPVTIWVPQFDDHGMTSGLVLLSTAVILLFMPRSR